MKRCRVDEWGGYAISKHRRCDIMCNRMCSVAKLTAKQEPQPLSLAEATL